MESSMYAFMCYTNLLVFLVNFNADICALWRAVCLHKVSLTLINTSSMVVCQRHRTGIVYSHPHVFSGPDSCRLLVFLIKCLVLEKSTIVLMDGFQPIRQEHSTQTICLYQANNCFA